jgi:hypothetical protein
MGPQEISVQSKSPKSFKLSYRIEGTFHCVTGMVVDKDDNLILADQSFLRMYSKDGKSNLIAHGSFFNRMIPNCFISDNKVSG